MRVCLVNPPCNLRERFHVEGFVPSIPMGLAYIAAVLEGSYSVHVIDAQAEGCENQTWEKGVCTIGLPWKKIAQEIKRYKPDVVGISCMFSSRFLNALKIAKIVKNIDPDIKTVMGGIHATIAPREVLKNPAVDFVLIGEAEVSIIELLRKLQEGKEDFDSIDGIGWKQKNQIHINPKTKFIEDLDKLPFPARHLFPMKKYFTVKQRLERHETGKISVSNAQRNTIITSRGCPFNCSFCSIHFTWGYKWRARSPRNVVDELKVMVEQYGMHEISFEDDNLTLNRKRMKEICELIIKEGLDIKWDTPNGVSVQTLDRELLAVMKKAGCCTLKFGIEHGDPNILNKAIHKPLTLNKVREVVCQCKELKVNTIGSFVLGMPRETAESIDRTIKFATELPLDEIGVAIATPYPGTEFYDLCIKKGYIKGYSSEDYSCDDDVETNAMFNTPTLSSLEVQVFRRKFYEEFRKSRIHANPSHSKE